MGPVKPGSCGHVLPGGHGQDPRLGFDPGGVFRHGSCDHPKRTARGRKQAEVLVHQFEVVLPAHGPLDPLPPII